MAKSAGARAIRNVVGVLVGVLVIAMLALLVRLVFEFFGALQSGPFWAQLKHYTDFLVLPLGVRGFGTPYGGMFDVEATISIVVLLIAEYLLTALRKRI